MFFPLLIHEDSLVEFPLHPSYRELISLVVFSVCQLLSRFSLQLYISSLALCLCTGSPKDTMYSL